MKKKGVQLTILADQVPKKKLTEGQKHAKKAKDAGYRGEIKVAQALANLGFERAPKLNQGDVRRFGANADELYCFIRGIEVKRDKGGQRTIRKWLQQNKAQVLAIDSGVQEKVGQPGEPPIVVMDIQTFNRLVYMADCWQREGKKRREAAGR